MMLEIRLCVIGGRSFNDAKHVFAELDAWKSLGRLDCILVQEGNVANFAQTWASINGVRCERFMLDWGNACVLARASHVLAFKGGKLTKSLTRKASRLGIPLMLA